MTTAQAGPPRSPASAKAARVAGRLGHQEKYRNNTHDCVYALLSVRRFVYRWHFGRRYALTRSRLRDARLKSAAGTPLVLLPRLEAAHTSRRASRSNTQHEEISSWSAHTIAAVGRLPKRPKSLMLGAATCLPDGDDDVHFPAARLARVREGRWAQAASRRLTIIIEQVPMT